MSPFAERMKELSDAAKYRGVARVAGVSDSSIRRWAKNVDLPTGTTRLELAEQLCLTARELDGEDPLPNGYLDWLKKQSKAKERTPFCREKQESLVRLVRDLVRQTDLHAATLRQLLSVVEEQERHAMPANGPVARVEGRTA